jgi:spore coat polysaccharide biosynthesis protein SpsF
MKKKIIAALACRNKSSRLYGKPLQNLDIEKSVTILDYMISAIKSIELINEVVLGISNGVENQIFVDIAIKNNLKYIIGDEKDVLSRLISCCNISDATDILRLSTESPYSHFEMLPEAINEHLSNNLDFTHLDDVPVGSGFELISKSALLISHAKGEERHRSELCTLYIRENAGKFKISSKVADIKYRRMDLRLTVDYPEDLVVCRAVYTALNDELPIKLNRIIDFLDENPLLKSLIEKYALESLEARKKIKHPLVS